MAKTKNQPIKKSNLDKAAAAAAKQYGSAEIGRAVAGVILQKKRRKGKA
jgi:hypothetical protein